MWCIVLVCGGIGCGKTTLINFLKNKTNLFNKINANETQSEVECETRKKCVNFYVIQFDSLCSIEEQEHLMKSTKGLRNFRADFLMAAERFITLAYNCENSIAGPLTERSYNLLTKLNSTYHFSSSNSSDTVIFVEDNFYYRSMRYDWFQIAKRTNLGFATIFLHCPLNIATYRNSIRGYQIPEDRIKKMLSFLEFPDPVKFKWEKLSVLFDSSPELTDLVIKEVIDVIKKALENPVEVVISKEKIEAQKICSKNVVHQSDKILRRLVSKIVSNLKVVYVGGNSSLKPVVSNLLKIRQKVLTDIKQGDVNLPEDLVEKIQSLGIESVLDAYEERLQHLFFMTLKEETFLQSTHINNL